MDLTSILSSSSSSSYFSSSSSLVFSNDNLRVPPISHSNLRFAGHQFNFRDKHRKARIATSSFTCFSAKLAQEDKPEESVVVVKEKSVSVILLAGGKGKRMGASMPKQYLPLLSQPIALYSFYTFSRMPQVKEIIVVCDPSYRDVFEDSKHKIHTELKFMLPGKERQDSVTVDSRCMHIIVFSMLQETKASLILNKSLCFVFLGKAIDLTSELVCIHDSARPLVSSGDVEKVLKDGWLNGAAVLGVPVKATIKEANNNESFVVRTLGRRTLWEMQTPQVIKPELLKKGFELVNREGLEVTDDVSIVEHLPHPVYTTEGSYTNIKVTTPDDLLLAERILSMDTKKSSG